MQVKLFNKLSQKEAKSLSVIFPFEYRTEQSPISANARQQRSAWVASSIKKPFAFAFLHPRPGSVVWWSNCTLVKVKNSFARVKQLNINPGKNLPQIFVFICIYIALLAPNASVTVPKLFPKILCTFLQWNLNILVFKQGSLKISCCKYSFEW